MCPYQSLFLTGAWTDREHLLQSCRFQVFNRIMSHTPLLGTVQCDFSWLNSHLRCWLTDIFFNFFSKSSINRKPPKHDKVAKVFLPSFNIFLITWALKWYPNTFSKALAQKLWSWRGEQPSQVQSGNPASCVHFYCFLLWWENIKYSLETKKH